MCKLNGLYLKDYFSKVGHYIIKQDKFIIFNTPRSFLKIEINQENNCNI